jgi:hypothetical protein
MFGTPWHANVRDARKLTTNVATGSKIACVVVLLHVTGRHWSKQPGPELCRQRDSFELYSEKVKLADKPGQLSCSVSGFPAKQQAESSRLLPKAVALTSCPVTELKLVQTANLCFKCKQLQGLTQITRVLVQRVLPGPWRCPQTLLLTVDCSSNLFWLSKDFERSLNLVTLAQFTPTPPCSRVFCNNAPCCRVSYQQTFDGSCTLNFVAQVALTLHEVST